MHALQPGTYGLGVNREAGRFNAIRYKIGPTCDVVTSSIDTEGTMVLTAAPAGGFLGTITMKDPSGTTTGTFNIPACTKTYNEYNTLPTQTACVP